MGIRDDFTEMICREYHPDYWSDDVVVTAGELASTLDQADWDWLAQVWPDWFTDSQRQLAGALLGMGAPAWPILEGMVRSPDRGVASEASFALQADRTWPGNAELLADIRRLREVLAPGLWYIVEDLERRSDPAA